MEQALRTDIKPWVDAKCTSGAKFRPPAVAVAVSVVVVREVTSEIDGCPHTSAAEPGVRFVTSTS